MFDSPEIFAHQTNFKANWTTRRGGAPVMRPNVPEDALVSGLLKLTWLKILKNSPRS
jgi:hypothetical protein